MMNIESVSVRREQGFTLIELMIVVAIIGILAAVAIPQFGAFRVKAYNASAASDVGINVTTMNAAEAVDGAYPTAVAAAISAGTISLGDYTLTSSDGVTIGHSIITSSDYGVCAKNVDGDTTYSQSAGETAATTTAAAAVLPASGPTASTGNAVAAGATLVKC